MPDSNFQQVRYKTFRGDKEEPHLLILAGVHGDEYEPVASAIKLLNIVPSILEKGKVTIVPIANKPAFEKASRYGEDGLDLARICPGDNHGTTTKKIAAELSELILKSDYVIDLHGGGDNYEIAPLSGYMLHPSEDVLNKQHELAYAFNLKIIWGTSCMKGRSLSVAYDHGIPAIYTEFGGGGGFKKTVVKKYVQGCLNVLNALGMSEGVLPSNMCEYVVEDYREESGHLQQKLPAVSDGFFEAEVSLGEFVKKGEPIGTITDPFGPSVSVCADQDGMIFLLRAIPSVKKGDSLGGILPITEPGKVMIS